MTNEEAIHKLRYSKKAYQMLIDEKVDSGKFVGKDVEGEWKADTPLDEANKSMIEALDMAIKALEQTRWIPVKWHIKTEEDEYERYPDGVVMIDSPMPEDGQEILITIKSKSGYCWVEKLLLVVMMVMVGTQMMVMIGMTILLRGCHYHSPMQKVRKNDKY